MQGKSVDIDKMIREYGEVDRKLLEPAFVMWNPRRNIYDKYFKIFKKSANYDLASIGYFGLHE